MNKFIHLCLLVSKFVRNIIYWIISFFILGLFYTFMGFGDGIILKPFLLYVLIGIVILLLLTFILPYLLKKSYPAETAGIVSEKPLKMRTLLSVSISLIFVLVCIFIVSFRKTDKNGNTTVNTTNVVSTTNSSLTEDIGDQNFCHTFSSKVQLNSRGFVGSDVFDLNEILAVKERLMPMAEEPKSNTIFTQQSVSALLKFQQKYDLSQTGYTDEATNIKLNQLYGCNAPRIRLHQI